MEISQINIFFKFIAYKAKRKNEGGTIYRNPFSKFPLAKHPMVAVVTCITHKSLKLGAAILALLYFCNNIGYSRIYFGKNNIFARKRFSDFEVLDSEPIGGFISYP